MFEPRFERAGARVCVAGAALSLFVCATPARAQDAPDGGVPPTETITIVEPPPAEAASSVHVSSEELRARPHQTPSDLLRQTPGLLVGQHAGGGKADQLFLRAGDGGAALLTEGRLSSADSDLRHPGSMTILAAFLSRVELGAPASLDDLTFIPLFCPDAHADADLLEEALAERTAEIVELDGGGDVNAVRCTNRGRRPLLVIDGEELIGAKQNRVLNASFLVAAGTTAVLPVSCVEQGRWRHQSPGFASSRRTLSARVRTDKLRRVADSVTLSGVYDADQGAVWRDVDTLLARSRVASPTRAYADLAAVRAGEIEARVERLAPRPGQVGLAAVRGEKLVAIDLLGSPGLYRRGWRKLARGLVAEVDRPASAPRAAEIVARALAEAAQVACSRATAIGAGETLHGVGAHVVVGAVAIGGQVVHAVIGGMG